MGLTANWMGRTELTHAIIHKDTSLALALLEQGADPGHADYTGCSDLYFAAVYSEPEVLRELLRRGADPDGKPGRMLPLLGAMDSAQRYQHQTEFDAYGQAFEMVRALLEAGADPDLSQSGRATVRQNAKYLAPGPIADYIKTYPRRNAQEEGV
ncbi:ankyrin repeat domain-containing protein [uncultured Oscillibacter sp.]|uniref:ankyrin repeat domain-containing protein n=1 Tax=uncultured Oscillibacter sp. TaxID=876091 RepID=UPI002602C345|nr:ankyrin repeat domain-containing protein [uncultured Oscillibacter sp.]